MKQRPYVHHVQGKITLTIEGVSANGTSPADASERLRRFAEGVDELVREYLRVGPRATFISCEVSETDRWRECPPERVR